MEEIDVRYLIDTNEIEVTDRFGLPTYYSFSKLKEIDSNERELGTEIEYLIPPNIHLIFYPEGYLLDWWIE